MVLRECKRLTRSESSLQRSEIVMDSVTEVVVADTSHMGKTTVDAVLSL